MIRKIKLWFIEWLGYSIILILGKTIRWKEYNYDRVSGHINSGCVLPFWHNRILLVAYYLRGRDTAAIISRHRDGEIIARVAGHLGHDAVRGSTGKGGAAAMDIMVEKVNEGCIMGITPDGPLGPRYKLQPGTIRLAQLTGKPVIPIIIGVKDKKILSSWDGFIIPRPFTDGYVHWGDPIWIEKDLSKDEFESRRVEVEKKMMELVETADKEFIEV